MKQREIKFRAWDEKRGQYFYDGDLFNDSQNKPDHPCQITNKGILWIRPCGKDSIIYDESGREGYTDWDMYCVYTKVELEQFTGLKDKNGVEIYEGDMLEFPNNGGIGFVINDGFQFAVESPGSQAVDYEYREVYQGDVVIGNIHEHKHLLK